MQQRTKRSVTIQDVAKAAGVSISTVSRVLNDRADVAPATYERVKEVIDELEYSSSLAARSMRSRKTGVIGLIMPDVGDSFSIQVIKGVNRAIADLDYDLLIYTSGDIRRNSIATKEQKYITLLNSSVTDGVIIVTPVSTRYSSVSPVVAVDPNINNPTGPAVMSTNFKGATEVTEYLISLGHKRIAFIDGRTDLISAHIRRDAYKQTLQRAEIPVDQELIVQGDFTVETGYKCAFQLFKLQEPPTAIFASNDQSAIGVIKAADDEGIRIPENLSLVGFDNVPESIYYDLTTVDQFIEQMGYIGTELLVDLIQGKDLEDEIEKIETELVIRGTARSI
jgi:LacI family transcriptional regulator